MRSPLARFGSLGAAAFGLLGALAACGANDTPSASDADGGDAGRTPAAADSGTPPPASRCARDVDCNGGRCVDIGLGAKACVHAKSCTGGRGADRSCGGTPGDESATGAADCCETRYVPGGTYDRFNDADFPAEVSPFLLDTFEVTAGRFRAWVEATDGDLRSTAPAEGEGAHPRIAGSGWRSDWDRFLPESRAGVDRMLGPEQCQVGSNIDDYGTLTWWTEALDAKVRSAHRNNDDVLAENTREALDGKALNCVPWYVLFAFCVWDGGRLPTDAEWGFATAAGDEQRAFPWGNPKASELAHLDDRDDLSRVPTFEYGRRYTVASLWDSSLGANTFPERYVYTWGGRYRLQRDNAAHVAPVGRRALGNGKWGHADLAGGMHEWMLDEGPVRPGTCTDCANVRFPEGDEKDPDAVTGIIPDFEERWYAGGARVVRGGAWDNAFSLATGQTKIEIEVYTSYPVKRTYRSLGGRCARDL
jgi:formylglycine-generating enzyme